MLAVTFYGREIAASLKLIESDKLEYKQLIKPTENN